MGIPQNEWTYRGRDFGVHRLLRGDFFEFANPSAKLPAGRLQVVNVWGEQELMVPGPWSLAARDAAGKTHYFILHPMIPVTLS